MAYDLRWNPPIELSSVEKMIAKRSCKNRKLFVFLRENRHLLFDEEFQEELAQMYRQTGAGRCPIPPAQMAMATLLQKYAGFSDNEVIAHLFDSKRWQMVIDCLGAEKALFSQATFYDFRMRLIETNMEQRILERTVEVARQTGGFSHKSLRLALDSAPLEGNAKVEDTVNLLGHAAKKAVACAARLTNQTTEELVEKMELELVTGSSVKAELDVDWSDKEQKKKPSNGSIASLNGSKIG